MSHDPRLDAEIQYRQNSCKERVSYRMLFNAIVLDGVIIGTILLVYFLFA